jgi:hypothetical protein
MKNKEKIIKIKKIVRTIISDNNIQTMIIIQIIYVQ